MQHLIGERHRENLILDHFLSESFTGLKYLKDNASNWKRGMTFLNSKVESFPFDRRRTHLLDEELFDFCHARGQLLNISDGVENRKTEMYTFEA